MSRPSWVESLAHRLRDRPENDARLRVAVVGVGQELRGDDAAGVMVARQLQALLPFPDYEPEENRRPAWLILDAGPAPENVTGPVRRFRPNVILFVDAADFCAAPGHVRLLNMQSLDGITAFTHALPLGLTAGYLENSLECETLVLGIQPAGDEIGQPLSLRVAESAENIAECLAELLMNMETEELDRAKS